MCFRDARATGLSARHHRNLPTVGISSAERPLRFAVVSGGIDIQVDVIKVDAASISWLLVSRD